MKSILLFILSIDIVAISVKATALNLIIGNSTTLYQCLELIVDATKTKISATIIWEIVRAKAVAPILRVGITVCLIMSVMLAVEAVFMAFVSFGVKILRRRPEKRYKWEPVGGDEETGSLGYPMVLIQIPMFNEKEVYKLSIGAACGLTWPIDRMMIQVLDDSTDPVVKSKLIVAMEIAFSWRRVYGYPMRVTIWHPRLAYPFPGGAH